MAEKSKDQQSKQQPTTERPEKRSDIGDSKGSMENHEKAAEIPPKTGSGTGSGDKTEK